MKRRLLALLPAAVLLTTALYGCELEILLPDDLEWPPESSATQSAASPAPSGTVTLENRPEYSGQAYVVLYDNQPQFDMQDIESTTSFESYAPLDELGRCGVAYANIGVDLMPTEERGSISQVKPSGWQSVRYDFVDGKYLYNRCHLIGFQLTGENANERNLITGTRYMNVEGMLPFENLVADYIKETGNHVLYRVTPVYESTNLVAEGVQMEALSVEDQGDGVCFNVFVYNIQPGVIIDYATGTSQADQNALESGEQHDYVLNTSSRKFHLPSCSGAKDMKEENRQEYTGSRDILVAQGYVPCGICNP
ncbi:MAG TPA: hypothetical protein DIT49_03100 [Clostridiales bacterium]|nr:hypothetical protein [Clostridiales bacterium]